MSVGLATLDRWIWPSHPLCAVTQEVMAERPEMAGQVVLAATEWAELAARTGRDPFSFTAVDFEGLYGDVREGRRRMRLRAIAAIWDTWDADRRMAHVIDPVRISDRREVHARRLTADQRQRLLADGFRDLRREPVRIGAARDLLAIGLLGSGLAGLEALTPLTRGNLGDGVVATPDGPLKAGDDVVVPAEILRVLLEREIGPLRPMDGLVPTVGVRYLRSYRRDDRMDMVPAAPAYLRNCLARRLRRASLDVRVHSLRYTAPSWLVGISDGTFPLPADLSLSLRVRCSTRARGGVAATGRH